MNRTENLHDRIYLLTHRATLHDAVVALSHPITFSLDRINELRRIISLAALLTSDASTMSPARLTYYFQHTEEKWRAVFEQVCQRTLCGNTTEHTAATTATAATVATAASALLVEEDEVVDVVSSEELLLSLQLLKSVFLLWPPSCQWQPPNLLLPRIFAAGSGMEVQLPHRTLQILRLTVVDVVMAFVSATKTVHFYYDGYSKDSVNKIESLHIDAKLKTILSQTFAKLSPCCSFVMDQSAVYDPHQKKKQQRSINAFLEAHLVLESYSSTR
jgi:hypothetical protein